MISIDHIEKWHKLPEEEKGTYYIDLVGTSLVKMAQWHESIVAYFKKLDEQNRRYIYLVTFTKKSNDLPDDEIERYITKLFKKGYIIEAHLSKELTKKNVSHWHVVVVSRKFLCKKPLFQHYINKYGMVDISKTRSKTLKNGLTYINKDNPSIRIK